ncbi:MAG TPA: hypothetical protein VHA37_01740, partial [Candidatus Saccharimonadales bacterium]|nr:hypothetical protein [Candidatus Saccharimonadales bacterium]
LSAPPESTDGGNVPHLFLVRNMFFPERGYWPPFHGHWSLLKIEVAPLLMHPALLWNLAIRRAFRVIGWIMVFRIISGRATGAGFGG